MDFLVTGSQAFGPLTADSDLDIVMYLEDAGKLQEWLGSKGIETHQTEVQRESPDYAGYYFNLLGILVNIITPRDSLEFEDWQRRTERLRARDPIKDKAERIKEFNRG